MRKVIFSAFVASILAVACAPKTAPSATTGEAVMPASPSTAAADISAGQAIFTTSCTKCHAPKTDYVNTHTYDEAKPVMNSMSKKAKLTPEQIQHLAAYVNSVAKK